MSEKNAIGHDPLAWLAETTESPEQTNPEIQMAASPDPVDSQSKFAIPESQTTPSAELSRWQEVLLPEIFTISELQAWQPTLKNHLGKRVQLNGVQVKRIDTAALQILLAFMNSPEITVGWVQPSRTLCEAAHWLGLTAKLSLPPYVANQP